MKHALFALAIIGCATAHPPPLPYDQPLATIHEAASLGATQIPTAREHLMRADEQLREARQTENIGYARASMLISRAQADADLALALAQEAAVRRDVKRTAAAVSSLRGGR